MAKKTVKKAAAKKKSKIGAVATVKVQVVLSPQYSTGVTKTQLKFNAVAALNQSLQVSPPIEFKVESVTA